MSPLSSPRFRPGVKTTLPVALVLGLLIGFAYRTVRVLSPPVPPRLPVRGGYFGAQSAAEMRARLVAKAELSPDDPEPALSLALFDRQRGALPEAEQELRAARERFPNSVDVAHQLGALYLNVGRNEEAAEPLVDAARRARGRAEIQVMAALACFRLGRYPEAEQYARATLRAKPESSAAYLLLARIYSSHGTAAQSQAAIQAYLSRASDPAPGYYLLARMYYRQGDAARAESSLQRALQGHEAEADYWALLGHIYGDLNNGTRRNEAILCYRKALAIKPHDPEIHAALGRALMRSQEWEPAVQELRIAMQNASDPGPLLYSLGHSLLRAGHAEEGRTKLGEYQAYQEYHRISARLKGAIKADPNDRQSRYALIRLCLQYRQNAAATAALHEAAPRCSSDPTWQALNAEAAALSKPEPSVPNTGLTDRDTSLTGTAR